MRRAVLAIVGTAAGTTLLVGLKAYGGETPATQNAAAKTEQTAPPAQPTGSARSKAPAGGGAPAPASKAAGGSGLKDGTFNGRAAQTAYGPVTVTISVKSGKITDVAAVLPNTGESKERAERAGPRLRQQTLTRQSAQLDTVSGATATSQGYRQSLQSAIDQAKKG